MAIVLDAFASYVGDLLKQVAQDDRTLLLGVSGEIASLDDRLNSLKYYLADAERRRITDQSVQGWVRKLKQVMYDATDILDLCHLKAIQLTEVDVACLDLLVCLRKPLFAHDIGSHIRALNDRFDAICKSAAAFNFLLEAYEDTAKPRRSIAADRKTGPVLGQGWSAVVGEKIEEDTRQLVQRLTNDNTDMKTIMVVAVVGTGGIGKTTLAKKVFNNETIQEVFDKKIWLSVTQEVNEVELLREALKSASGGDTRDSHSKSMLVAALVQAITDKRFFLVLDDMWSERAWEWLLKVPLSHGRDGSCVLLTTRHAAVARGMRAAYPYHHVNKLNPEDAWSLLKKQVASSDMEELEIDDTLKDIGMEIIHKCEGLPLAVKVLGGLLRRREKQIADWEQVLQDFIRSVPPAELNDAIYLSYQDLHPCLKQCFLHYSLLPKNIVFFDVTVIGMWISEGFLHGDNDDLEKLGEECYKELIHRNLIEPVRYADEWASSMHDVVRSFAQNLARDEALVVSSTDGIRKGALQSQKFLRLSIETNHDEFEWKLLQGQKSLRTLILVGELKIDHGNSLLTFPNLRILHIENAIFTSALVESLHQLKHLRYLHISNTDIHMLPEDIGNMQFLQYISIVGGENLMKLPDSIVKVEKLRCLNLIDTSINAIPRGFCGLTNLRTLSWFLAYMDSGGWCSLQELGKLSNLRTLGLYGLNNVSASSFATEARLGEKVHLTHLVLECGSGPLDQQQLIEEVLDELAPPPCLEKLVIEEYFGNRLPNWIGAPASLMVLKGLKHMKLYNLSYCTQLPDGLGELPLLQSLEIIIAPAIRRVGPELFQSQLHHGPPLRYPFPRLRDLTFDGMMEWEEWEWEEQMYVQCMPSLEELVIESCNLRTLPPGLSFHARALKLLFIDDARHLQSLDNFASVAELHICFCPELESISSMPTLQKLTIEICPKLTVLKDVPQLKSLVLEDYELETLPGYLQFLKPRYLLFMCNLGLLKSISMRDDGPEWQKIGHIRHVKAYAEGGGDQRKWYVLYDEDLNNNFNTNITDSSKSEAPSTNPLSKDDDKLLGSDDARGSAAPSTYPLSKDDDELVGSDDARGSAAPYTYPLSKDDDELVGSDDARGSADDDDKLIGSDDARGSADDDDELIGSDDARRSTVDPDQCIGIDGPCENIIKVLMNDQDTGKQEPEVVSICGIEGLGKTIIANAVYRKIRNEFYCRAFVEVPQASDKLEVVIRSIFDKVRCPYPQESDDTQRLINILKQFLQDKRYLIVLDDIWDLPVWEAIKPALIPNNKRSGIIATTCKVDVAESIGGVYKLPLLSYEDSKRLFYKKTYFGSEDRCPSEYREVSKKILNKCGQLPLAIITISSLLPIGRTAIEEWKKVCNSIGSGLENGDSMKEMRRKLSRSYDGLSEDLRRCLQYISIFPEDYVIRRDNLIQRWIAEGLLPVKPGQSLQELGESYFYELIDTGMIQPVEFDITGKALACHVPVMMLDFIVYLLKTNGIPTIILSGQQRIDLANKQVQRLSLQHSTEFSTARAAKSFRHTSSLSIFCDGDLMTLLPRFQRLRVLHLEGCNSLENKHIVKCLRNTQLMYLIIGSGGITEIPPKIGDLRFLQTLDLSATGIKELPSTIVHLRRLRCLLVSACTKVPAGIGNLQDLEELADVNICKSPGILEDICTMPELRVLRINLLSWDESYSELLVVALCKMSTRKLKYLSIVTCCSLDFEPAGNNTRNIILPVVEHLEKLEILRSTLYKLPIWIDQLSNLQSLSVEVYQLEDALRILGNLPALLFLSLTTAKVGDKLVVLTEGFGCLKTFLLYNRAMGIKFAQGAMKRLERLELSFQAALTEDFSFGLENLLSLNHVQVEIVCFSATGEMVKGAEDAIRSMIAKIPGQPRPKLDIRRTVEQYMVTKDN